jgi:hypothetical protein
MLQQHQGKKIKKKLTDIGFLLLALNRYWIELYRLYQDIWI